MQFSADRRRSDPERPPGDRLTAFGCAMLDRLYAHSDLLLEAEVAGAGGWMRSPPYAVHRLHIRVLIEQARPASDIDYLADVLLGALSAEAFAHQRHVEQMGLDRLKAGYGEIVERLLA